uniref:Uncharacterized protein n=1 Tax=Acrobeloides nanus TaxID=290746 RepID=A0A914DDK8_9BILA
MSCPSGYQSLGISCQSVFTCIQATTSPVECLNGMCCLTSNDNRNFNPETCPNGGQSIGISCQSVKTCLQATPLPVACQHGMCCLISSTTDRFGIENAGHWNLPSFNPGTCPNGGQSIGMSCQSVTTCLQAITSSVACQNALILEPVQMVDNLLVYRANQFQLVYMQSLPQLHVNMVCAA